MKEFEEKDDKLLQEKHEGDEHHKEIIVKNCPPYNSDFQLQDAKPETVLIQEKDFRPGPENYSARTEPSIRTNHMSNLEFVCESHHRNLECSKDFSRKCGYNAPYLATATPRQDPAFVEDVTPTNISSSSTLRPAKFVLSIDVTRNRNRKVESHHRKWGGKANSTSNGVSKLEKGKEAIFYEADDSRSCSNRRATGRENFECFSSSGIVSTVKRKRIYEPEPEKLAGGKRLNSDKFSFMNWVASITNGLSRPRDGPSEAFQHPSQNTRGEYFRSNFQAMCHPDNNESSSEIKCIDHQKEMDALKGIEGEKASNVMASSFPDSSFSFGNGEKEDISTGPVTSGALHSKVLDSSKRFSKDVSQVKSSPSAAVDSCAKLMVQNSLWVTRLSRGVHSPQLKPLQCSNCLDLSAQRKISYPEAKKIRLSENPRRNSVSRTDLHGSVRTVTEKISSKHCERSKPTTSSFAWRFDALKHAKPLNISDENTGMVKICLFCGRSDHCIRECSEVVEAKLDKYLKSISVLGNIKKASCFCILCFQLEHWASSCPNASSKGNQISLKANGLSEVNLNSTAKKIHENQSLIDYDGAIMLRPEGEKDQHQVLHGRIDDLLHGRRTTVSQKDNKDIETDLVVCEEVISHKNESLWRDTIKDRAEDAITSFSSENDFKKSEFKSFCSRLPTAVINEPKGIFIYVRKLRLSRRDVLRWMKSRVSLYNLGGFFLRLRIGKLDKGFGGTSYHVACINGTSCQSSISVCVGSSTYSVNTSFISNHDFNENELKAWWFQNLRDGTKMASSEELNDKFQLRLKFGF